MIGAMIEYDNPTTKTNMWSVYWKKKKKKTKTNNETPGVPYGGLKHNFIFQLKYLKINNSLCFELLYEPFSLKGLRPQRSFT